MNIRSGAPAVEPVCSPSEQTPSVLWVACSPTIGWRLLKLHGVSVSQKVHGVSSVPPGFVQPLEPVGQLLRPALGLAALPWISW